MSQWLDGERGLIGLVAGDLRRQGVRQTGRRGLPAESVLRCALLKQQRQLSYEELAFHLEDSASFRAFARLPLAWTPKKSVLHYTIAAIRAETWEAINQALLASAKQERLESGATVRLDSTVTEALMHEPSDSTLLSDAVRVISRLLHRAEALPGAPSIRWRDRRRLAKKRARAIEYSRGRDKKRQLYRDLIAPLRSVGPSCRRSPQGWPKPPIRRSCAGVPRSTITCRWSRASSPRPNAACSTVRRCQPGRSWSACSSRTPISFSKVGVRFNTGTS
jgi:IS5 family transposase